MVERKIIPVRDNTIRGGSLEIFQEDVSSQNRAIAVRNGTDRRTGLLSSLMEGMADLAISYPRAVLTAVGLRAASTVIKPDENYSVREQGRQRRLRRIERGEAATTALKQAIRWELKVVETIETAKKQRQSIDQLEKKAADLVDQEGLRELDAAYLVGQSTEGPIRPEETELAQRMVTRELTEGDNKTGSDSWLDGELAREAYRVHLEAIGGAVVDKEEYQKLISDNPKGQKITLISVPRDEAFVASLMGARGWRGNMWSGSSVDVILEDEKVRIKRGQETDTVANLNTLYIDTDIPDGVEAVLAGRSGDLGGEKMSRTINRILGTRRVPMPGTILLGREEAGEVVAIPVLDVQKVATALVMARRAFGLLVQRSETLSKKPHVHARDKEGLKQAALSEGKKGMYELPRRAVVERAAEEIKDKLPQENSRDRSAVKLMGQIHMNPNDAAGYIREADFRYRELAARNPDQADFMYAALVNRAAAAMLPNERAAKQYVKNALVNRETLIRDNPILGGQVHEILLSQARGMLERQD